MARWKTSPVSRIDVVLEGEQRVGPEAEAQGLEADHLTRGDVAQVDVGAEAGDEMGLERLVGSFEQQHVGVDVAGQDVLDQPLAELTVRAADAAATALAG